MDAFKGGCAAAARNVAVVYCSQTGFTKRYAEWLAEDLGCAAIPYARRSGIDLSNVDVLVFCSWFHAASIKGSKWLKRAMRDYPALQVVVLATGATPMPCDMCSASEVEEAFSRTFPAADYPDLPHFYCQGGFEYNRLGVPDKIAMKMFFKMNAKAAETDPKAAEMLRVMGNGFDGVKRAYLEPVLAHVRGLGGLSAAQDSPCKNCPIG